MDAQTAHLQMKNFLVEHKVRPTKIRMNIAGLLFDGVDKHVTVENVIDLARNANIKTSVASVYNTLNQFASAGMLRRVSIVQGKAFFDTNLSDHHHFFYVDEETLEDIPAGNITIEGLPKLPKGRSVKSIDVTVRI